MRARPNLSLQATLTLLASLASAGSAEAQVRLTENTLELAEGGSPLAAEIEDAAWLEGRWTADALGGVVHEVWAPPSGGTMMGMFKLVKDGRTEFYEIFTILEVDGGLVLRLKHFDSALHGWEERTETVDFPLLRVEPDALWFGGLTFRRDGPDAMVAHLAMGSGEGVREATFRYRRVE